MGLFCFFPPASWAFIAGGGGKPRGHREGPPEGGKPREAKASTDTGPVARSQGLACRAFRGRGRIRPVTKRAYTLDYPDWWGI